jgi:predicted RNA-binding protein with TRAM domain
VVHEGYTYHVPVGPAVRPGDVVRVDVTYRTVGVLVPDTWATGICLQFTHNGSTIIVAAPPDTRPGDTVHVVLADITSTLAV